MLVRLLRTHLAKYRKLLIVVVALQAAQTICALFLPTLNADIIDRGVATGDSGYIWSHGLVMLLVSVAQIGFAIRSAAPQSTSFNRPPTLPQ